jgi:uncharacterized membrane protein YciS (DUF1049 family)
MIPKESRNRATIATLFALGLVLAGTVIGLLWVSTYMPK